MKIFIDTANVDEIRKAVEMGVADGVTTNPTLLSREVQRTGRSPKEILVDICNLVDGPVSAEVIALDVDGIVREGRELAGLHPNIVIKVPMTTDGLAATRRLVGEGIRTNTTLVFSVNQALLCAKAGTTFVSPFIGRLDDVGHIGMDLVEQILTVYDNYGFTTEIIVASIRHPMHVAEAAMLGADIATVPFRVIEQLVKHPLTDVGIERFLTDWKRVQDANK